MSLDSSPIGSVTREIIGSWLPRWELAGGRSLEIRRCIGPRGERNLAPVAAVRWNDVVMCLLEAVKQDKGNYCMAVEAGRLTGPKAYNSHPHPHYHGFLRRIWQSLRNIYRVIMHRPRALDTLRTDERAYSNDELRQEQPKARFLFSYLADFRNRTLIQCDAVHMTASLCE